MTADTVMGVDVALVLAIDSSGSISNEWITLQIQHVDALRHRRFIEAVQAGPLGRVAATFVEWSDRDRQDRVAGWTIIHDLASAQSFAQAIAEAPHPVPGVTSISGAIDFSAKLIAGSGYDAARRVIDISGNGSNNDGRPVTEARDEAAAAGITINGLPILDVEPALGAYYRDNVIVGPGAFIVVARNMSSFSTAVQRKLLFEVAGVSPPTEDA